MYNSQSGAESVNSTDDVAVGGKAENNIRQWWKNSPQNLLYYNFFQMDVTLRLFGWI